MKPRFTGRLGQEGRRLLSYFAASRILVFLAGIAAYLWLPKGGAFGSYGYPILLDMWIHRWDAWWYLTLAVSGYSYIPGQASNAGYFPLYPVFVRAFSLLTDPVLAGVLVSNAALLVAAFAFYRLVRLDFSKRVGARAALYMLIFPTSFFFSAIHSESLFLALSVGSFYFARLGKWKEAGTLGFLAALTRPVGVMLFPAFLAEYALQKNILKGWKLSAGWHRRVDRSAAWIGMVLLGPVLLAAYWLAAAGDPLVYVKAQTDLAGRYISFPFSGFLELLAPNIWVLRALPFAIFGLVMLYLMRNRLRQSYTIYTLFSLLLPLSTASIRGMQRYVLVIFPIFIVIALLVQKDSQHRVIVAVSAALLAAYTIGFVNIIDALA
jgi:hypothetical protein